MSICKTKYHRPDLWSKSWEINILKRLKHLK
jgi:hypothetical protein